MNAKTRLELFGFNLKKETKLTQKALNLWEQDDWAHLYKVLHRIKEMRKNEHRH